MAQTKIDFKPPRRLYPKVGLSRAEVIAAQDMGLMPALNLREAMPTVADWIDALREAFGARAINEQIRRGMAGQSGFFAAERGHTVGTPMPHAHGVSPTPTDAYSKLKRKTKREL